MRIIQQKRRKPHDVTHRGHLCKCTVFFTDTAQRAEKLPLWHKAPSNIILPWLVLPLHGSYFHLHLCFKRPLCLTSICWEKESTPTKCVALREMWVIPSTKALPLKCTDLRSQSHTHTHTHTHTHAYSTKFPVTRNGNGTSTLPTNANTKACQKNRKLFLMMNHELCQPHCLLRSLINKKLNIWSESSDCVFFVFTFSPKTVHLISIMTHYRKLVTSVSLWLDHLACENDAS